MPVASRIPFGGSARWPLPVLVVALMTAGLAPLAATGSARGDDLGPPDHLVVSEVVTGGASASDELIELHNPTAAALPLEGLEVVYVTSTGATISRRASWELGAPSVPAGGHVLIANEAGIFASVADATYASGMAATGGSVAIRILGAVTAIDAAGWGTAASTWLEGTPAAAAAAGASIERLPGAAMGSGQDTGDNVVDFVERLVPEPQNLGSPPTPAPGPSTPAPDPTPTPTPGPVSTPIPTATPSPGPFVTSIADARAAPDGTTVTIEAVALTGSDFHDGGGFVADSTAAVAVLLADGTFATGDRIRVTGDVDDRFSQRTLRGDPGGLDRLGTASQPAAVASSTGDVGEAVEGRLVRIRGVLLGSATTLTSGLAFDIDDGSGATRVVVGTGTSIDTATWHSGTTIDLVGVVGQRDSSGSGTSGYRVMPRAPADVSGVRPPGSSPGAGPDPARVVSIAEARGAEVNARIRIRGVVTLPSGLVEDGTAVIQDSTGAILVRLEGHSGRLRLRDRVEVDGQRSTLGGMETVRATGSILPLGSGSEPPARTVRTGEVDEADEARLVVARGAIVASARSSSLGTVFFEIDDGSGPIRVSMAAALRADSGPLGAGTWVEVRGVLGQETTGSQPNEGYRIWPRAADEVRVTAPAAPESPDAASGGSGGGPADTAGAPTGSLDDLDAADLSQLRIGATLVLGRWEELGVGGLLWDGGRLVAVDPSSGDVVGALTRAHLPPISLSLGGLRAAGSEAVTGIPVVRLGTASDATAVIDAAPAAPISMLDGELPAWASFVGWVSGPVERRVLLVDGERVTLENRCDDQATPEPDGLVSVTGVALRHPLRLLVPCGGVRSAPTMGVGADATDRAGATGPPPAPALEVRAATDIRRPIVAGLLLVAAFILVGGALVRRFQPGVERAQPADIEQSGASEARLTLVRVPREGGP